MNSETKRQKIEIEALKIKSARKSEMLEFCCDELQLPYYDSSSSFNASNSK